jgi:hypothetical protein
VFRSPLGAGTVLDLEQAECLALAVEVHDPDSSSLVLDQAPPLIEGATLEAAADGRTGQWRWCPDARQIAGADRYTLQLRADDGDNPPVIKEFVIVLRRRRGDGCPGQAPVIAHAPMDVTTRLDLAIVAEVGDDLGIGTQPYLVWTTEAPSDPIDFGATTLVPMTLVAGDLQAGTWRATIPNPLANEPDGTAAPLYYLVSVTDDDDADGDCDHRTDDPESGMHRVTVTAGGDETLGPCEPCSFDVQCGDEDDLCVLPVTGGGGGRCGQACGSDDDCDQGYACSPTALPSVEGRLGRQCVPASGSCDDVGGCDDDDHEPDATPAEALGQAPLPTGTLGGRMLCGGDEDWYALELPAAAQISIGLEGDAPPDIDLSLTTGSGVLLVASVGLSSSELVAAACLDPGTYLVRVYSIDDAPSGAYALELQAAPCGAAGGGDCCTVGDGPGCGDPAVQACVCAADPFCCSTAWDAMCVQGVGTHGCGTCPP